MITNSELNAVELSPTKKDFYQIWNELLSLAGKISERWDPTSTNESDPGIVLLKVLTAVADKLNYTIDANTLEAFMPSAAQEESMRKLTEMLGYSMKYYRSATTDVKIAYNATNKEALVENIFINKYTSLKDIDSSINYITLEDAYLTMSSPSTIVPCMEGELVECETDDNNIVSMFHLDDFKRYFLPETQIAENGIFITNISDTFEGEVWTRVENLNTQPIGSHVFKFGFDSKEGLPYVQFPADISNLIEDGLKIKYLRTSGLNGNISPKTLCKMEAPTAWDIIGVNKDKAYFNVENYIISNDTAAINGCDKEGLNDAYNNYKKTVGTFDTLVTCRDYMNKIYQMTVSDSKNSPLVSNIIVSDIRDDINKAMTITTFTPHGIEYKTMAKPVVSSAVIDISEEDYSNLEARAENIGITYRVHENSDESKTLFYARLLYNGSSYSFIKINPTSLTHFDLVLYPFNTITGLNTKNEFIKSFKYSNSNLTEIKGELEENKTLSHNFIEPNDSDIACIKNYYQLTARITTIKKVNALEQADILGKVYSKIYETFNMRKVDFGEELSYDQILKVLETADPRIRSVTLEDPDIITKYCLVNGTEYEADMILDEGSTTADIAKRNFGNSLYNKLALNNVLAGRIELFNYDLDFKPDYTETAYPGGELSTNEDGEEIYSEPYRLIYPDPQEEDENGRLLEGFEVDTVTNRLIAKAGIHRMVSEFIIDENNQNKNLKLQENEVVQFRKPTLKTLKTYPAYVNYFAHLNSSGALYKPAIPATMQTLLRFIERNASDENKLATRWEMLINPTNTAYTNLPQELIKSLTITLDFEEGDTEKIIAVKREAVIAELQKARETRHALFTREYDENKQKYIYSYVKDETIDEVIGNFSSTTSDTSYTYYYISFDGKSAKEFSLWRKWIISLDNYYYDNDETTEIKQPDGTYESASGKEIGTEVFKANYKLKGLYKYNGTDFTKNCGSLVDNEHNKFKLIDVYTRIIEDPFTYYYVPRLWVATTATTSITDDDSPAAKHTMNGLGQNGEFGGIPKDTEYELKKNEYLLINYTSSTTTDGTDAKTKINEYYGPGTIIKPNFNLIDSEEYRSTFKFTKTDGFNFDQFGITRPEGMYSLGTEEQIEIRDFVSVKLNEVNTNIYWELQEEVPDQYNRVKFPFDGDLTYYTDATYTEVSSSETNYKRYLSYTLKDGEYLFYTGANKTDLAWYGKGTKIVRTAFTPEIYKYVSDNAISAEDISIHGLNMNIPWRAFDFSTTGRYDKSLSLVEYEYINLTAGDILCSVTPEDAANDSTNIAVDINGDFKPIKTAQYALNMGTKDISESDKINLQPINMSTQNKSWVKWEVGSHLEFNVSPTTAQTLYNRDYAHSSITLYGLNRNNSTQKWEKNRLIAKLSAQKNYPLSIKTNQPYQTSVTDLDVTEKEYSDTGIVLKEKTPLKVKVFSSQPISQTSSVSAGGEFISLNNFGDNFTKINFENTGVSARQRAAQAAVKLNLVIPEDRFGLLMLYNINDTATTDSTKIRFIKANDNSNSKISTPKIFNYTNKISSYGNWWGGENNKELNPHGLGKTVSEALGAVEGSEFKLISETEFDYLNDTCNKTLYKRETAFEFYSDDELNSLKPTANTRYDYFNITKVTADGANKGKNQVLKYTYSIIKNYDEEAYIGTLLDEGGSTCTLYQLRSGINILQVDSSCILEIYSDLRGTGNLVLSNLDIVYKDKVDPENSTKKVVTSINDKLNYKITTKDDTTEQYIEPYQQLLNDIKEADPNYLFYYNLPVQNAVGIDMNKEDPLDVLDHPINWYDINNINNKFVISEIDADYLKTGITIAKASRSSY